MHGKLCLEADRKTIGLLLHPFTKSFLAVDYPVFNNLFPGSSPGSTLLSWATFQTKFHRNKQRNN